LQIATRDAASILWLWKCPLLLV